MEIRYTRPFLNKLEDLIAETDYVLRYEKGDFKSGYCIIKQSKVIVVNKYYPLEGKINCLQEIIRSLGIDAQSLQPKNRELLKKLQETVQGT
jgi:hypothetical protein